MTTRARCRLGRNDREYCRIALGTIPLARLARDEAIGLISYALDQGIDCLDTARAYGPAEEYVGAAIAGRAQRPFLATKSMARDGDALRRELDASLTALGVDHVDCFYLHQLDSEGDFAAVTAPDGALAAALAARDEGLFSMLGVSGHFTPLLDRVVDELPIDVLLGRFNLTAGRAEQLLIDKAKTKGISIATMKVFEGGFITRHTENALRHAIHHETIDLILIGCDNRQQIDGDLAALHSSAPLSAAERAALAERAQLLKAEAFCTYCGYCSDSCTKEIPIAHVFNLEGKLKIYGSDYGFAGSPGAAMYLADFAAAIDSCDECGICETRCPNRLPIRKLLKDHGRRFRQLLDEK